MSDYVDILHAFSPPARSMEGYYPSKSELMNDRRSSERHRMVLQLAILTSDGERQLCLIQNIGAGGLKVRFFGESPKTSIVSVTMRGDKTFEGQISWQSGDLLGLAFTDPLTAEDLFSATSGHGARHRGARLPVNLRAQLWCDGKLIPAQVLNLSPTGAAVSASRCQISSRQISLKLPGLSSIPAQVRWSDGDRIGLSFNTPLLLVQIQRALHVSCVSDKASALAA